jgi:hypothetical protein
MPDAGPAINSRGGRTQAGGKPGAPGVRPQTAWRIDSTKPIGWDGINSTDLVLSFPPAGPTTTHETGATKATTAMERPREPFTCQPPPPDIYVKLISLTFKFTPP